MNHVFLIVGCIWILFAIQVLRYVCIRRDIKSHSFTHKKDKGNQLIATFVVSSLISVALFTLWKQAVTIPEENPAEVFLREMGCLDIKDIETKEKCYDKALQFSKFETDEFQEQLMFYMTRDLKR